MISLIFAALHIFLRPWAICFHYLTDYTEYSNMQIRRARLDDLGLSVLGDYLDLEPYGLPTYSR